MTRVPRRFAAVVLALCVAWAFSTCCANAATARGGDGRSRRLARLRAAISARAAGRRTAEHASVVMAAAAGDSIQSRRMKTTKVKT